MGASLTPDQPEDLLPELPIDKQRLRGLVQSLIESGELVQVPGGLVFSVKAIERARQALLDHLAGTDGLTVGEFNKLVSTSRKFGIPLLQYFEQQKLLSRDGDVRRLVKN